MRARSCSAAGGAATNCASRSGIPGSAFPQSNFKRFLRSSIKSTIRRASAPRALASVLPLSSASPSFWATLSMSVPVPGKGSVFAIEVPLGEHVAPSPRLDRGEVSESAHQTGAILVVEDDPSVREMLALLLEEEGHRTTTAEDGRRALELAARSAIRPDLVVVDYNLPKGLNGLQVVAGLRQTLDYEIPAVILTGDISTDTLREIAHGGHLHLNKPVKAKELTDLIQSHLAETRLSGQANTRKLVEAGGDGPRAPDRCA